MKDWNSLYQYVDERLQKQLPPYLTYHNREHTHYVLEMAGFIAKQEDVNDEELILIQTAALFHDLGFTEGDDIHETRGIRIAETVLPSYGYTSQEIKLISGMIRATEIPQKPQNTLERILADADLEYLGTDTFEVTGEQLYRELKYKDPALTREKWNQVQIRFLTEHRYHTPYCVANREPAKQQNLLLLKQRLPNV